MLFKKAFPVIFLLSLTLVTVAKSAFWQQHIVYDIDVRLNDNNNTLSGFVQMEYHNNSPDTLHELLIHLWPNAYKDRNTPFAKQQIKLQQTDFHYADESERGYINQLNFIVDNKAAEWHIDSSNMELAIVQLQQELLPGEKVIVGTPFKVKIPAPFSRMGHKNQQYQITQWYPKPAVYDEEGWHPMPYLDQGEFFSEFADYNVRITLPANYVVAASGQLTTESERDWLEKRGQWSSNLSNTDEWHREVPKSDSTNKTLNYELKNAHDFAWFADKRYLTAQRKIKLKGREDSVLIQSFYLPEERKLWHKALDFCEQGLHFYNDKVGTYAYPEFSAVSGALGAGSGMEYPGITVIGKVGSLNALETVLVHEIGHNWYYGMLANNERAAPWLDESINSYYEKRYILEQHPDWKLVNEFPKLADFFGLRDFEHNYQNNLFYLFSARRNESQPVGLHSEEFSSLNYGAMLYAKGAMAFDYLSQYLGQDRFDKIMQAYFREYRFRHHHPDDFRNFFEKATGKDLTWFFEELIEKDQRIDYSIEKVRGNNKLYELKIKNKTNFSGPFPIEQYHKDSLLSETWIAGFEGKAGVLVKKQKATHLYIDRKRRLPEFNTQNNNYRMAGSANR
ncbi:MAG: M1 family metallopeptidase, partial [Chitinophagales bacterium]